MLFPRYASTYSPRSALLLVLLWMSVIFLFSSFPGAATSGPPPLWYFIERKGAHVVEYAVLTVLLFRYFRLVFDRESFRRVLLLSCVLALAYATTDELHQFFVSYRGARLSDVAIDGAGVLLAGASLLLSRYMKNRPQRSGVSDGKHFR